jgi:hypothetical protein
MQPRGGTISFGINDLDILDERLAFNAVIRVHVQANFLTLRTSLNRASACLADSAPSARVSAAFDNVFPGSTIVCSARRIQTVDATHYKLCEQRECCR